MSSLPKPTREEVSLAIERFLTEQFEKKTEKERKSLKRAQDQNDLDEIAKLEEVLRQQREKYQLDEWLRQALKWAKQLSFGTHTSKGVHSSSRGDTILFSRTVEHGYVGTHSVASRLLDATGGAAALPLVAFFDYLVNEAYRIRDVIVQHPELLKGLLGRDPEFSDQCQQVFYDALTLQPEKPRTDSKNKQLLWPIDPEHDQYHLLIPLYPSVLAHELYQNIQERLWNKGTKAESKNHDKPDRDDVLRQHLLGLASIQLGGAQPQNISLLNSRQRGKQYLLPSLPPRFERKAFHFSRGAKTLFDCPSYRYQMRGRVFDLVALFDRGERHFQNREDRDAMVADILADTFYLASLLQDQPTGWSKSYDYLDIQHKIWLDPNDEDSQALRQEYPDWREHIIKQFAHWLQDAIRTEIANLTDSKLRESDFADPEFNHWKKLISEAIEASQRLGEGVFQ